MEKAPLGGNAGCRQKHLSVLRFFSLGVISPGQVWIKYLKKSRFNNG